MEVIFIEGHYVGGAVAKTLASPGSGRGELKLPSHIFGGQMRVRDAIKLIEADGWRLVSIKGSHRQFKHPFKRGHVIIAGKLDMDLHPKTLKEY